MRVALFITCLADSFSPRSGIATVRLLEWLGYEVVFPRAQTCCGQPMFNNGYHDEASRLARHMVDVFEPFDVVVTPSGSCAATIRENLPTLFGDTTEADEVRRLGARTFETVEFLMRVLKVDLRELGACRPGRVTYHYSCHLRGLGIQPADMERVLSQIADLEYVPMERIDLCCGFGGTFALHYPTISGQMVHDKLECARRAEADTLVCNDTGCLMNIAGAWRRAGLPRMQFLSMVELIAESLGLMGDLDSVGSGVDGMGTHA
ncbi:MAG: (Fe-S)-binding protein [Planctomycetes bacterium]|nr:(Fe-S)-binding protein [Planctomycetota bacterium]